MSHNVIYVDQPDLALPRTMYLDTESYADYIAAYKTFMLETAMVMARYVMKFVFCLVIKVSKFRKHIFQPKLPSKSEPTNLFFSPDNLSG